MSDRMADGLASRADLDRVAAFLRELDRMLHPASTRPCRRVPAGAAGPAHRCRRRPASATPAGAGGAGAPAGWRPASRPRRSLARHLTSRGSSHRRPTTARRCRLRPQWSSPPLRNRRWSGGSRRHRFPTPVRCRPERRQLRPTRPKRRAPSRHLSRSQPPHGSRRHDRPRLTESHRSGLSRLAIPSRWPKVRPSRPLPRLRHLPPRPDPATSRTQSRPPPLARCSRTRSSRHLALPELPTQDARQGRGGPSPLPRTFACPVRRPRQHPNLPAGPSRWTSSSRGSTRRRRPGPTWRATRERLPSRPTTRGSA